MPGPYKRIDEPNVNQFVVTQPPVKKAAKKSAASDDKDAASKSDKAS